LENSLSIVVPVCNAELWLARHVTQLLEVLPDLTSNFELLIVDDASTDQTEEVAYDLSVHFPQVRIVRHKTQMGRAVAARTGIQQTKGDIIFVYDDCHSVSPAGLRKMWSLRDDPQLIIAQSENEAQPLNSALIHQVMEWGDQLKQTTSQNQGGVQMIRRRVVQQLSDLAATDNHLEIKRLIRTDEPTKSGHKQSPNILDRLKKFTATGSTVRRI